MHTHTLWAARVAAGTVLPDKRLPARLACILETFAERPSDAIPQAAGSWGQAKGIYRFLANQRVRPAALHLGLKIWARPAGNAVGPEAKESGTWLQGIDQARQVVWETAWAAGAAAPPRLMHRMDREGDVYEVLQWVEEVGESAIIRCVQNRRVEDPLRLAHAAVRAQPVLDRVTITVPRSHGKPARTATVEMRALTTTLRPDRAKYPHAWPLAWTLVEVWEPTPALEDEALHWLLWTREPAMTLVEVQEVVRKYTCRWPIEIFQPYYDSSERLSLTAACGNH